MKQQAGLSAGGTWDARGKAIADFALLMRDAGLTFVGGTIN
jgi:hypothetical protein